MYGSALLVVIDIVMMLQAVAVFSVRVSSGAGGAVLLTVISTVYSALYSIQACTGTRLEMEWHVFAQHLPLQHLFILTTCGAILFDQCVVAVTQHEGSSAGKHPLRLMQLTHSLTPFLPPPPPPHTHFRLLVSNLDTTFTALIVNLSTFNRAVVISALCFGFCTVVAMMLAVNLHSGVQRMLEEFVVHKLVHGGGV